MPVSSVIDSEYTQSVDARLSSYEAYVNYQVQEARRAIPFLGKFFDVKNARVLEVGTGRGGKGIAYATQGMNVTAFDIDVPALELGLKSARERNANMRFLVSDGARMPFPNNYFDAILFDSVIEHVSDPQAVLLECARVLKPNGIVFVVFPPFYGPLSGHIDDYIMIPWFHLLPRAMVERGLMVHQNSIGILTPRAAYEVYTSLNGLTIFNFKRFARRAGFRFDYFRARPFLTHPGTRLAVGLVSAIRRPSRVNNILNVLAQARREFSLGTFLLFLLLAAISPLVFIPIAQEMAAGGVKAVLRKP